MKRYGTAALAVVMACALAGTAAAQKPGKAPAAPSKVAAGKFKSLPGGLKYAVLKPGKGKTAGHGEVEVHYTGWLQKGGKKFDSSLDRGKAIRFVLGHGQVIQGWEHGVKGMKEGERRQLVIPPALAYGPSGSPDGAIPPNSTLVFEVELVKVHSNHNH